MNSNKMKKRALITGATSGIGEAAAKALARKGYHLIITGRRSERLHLLAETLRSEYKIDVLPLHFDVRNNEQVELHLGNLSGEWRKIDLLLNNAGLASGLSSIQEGDLDDWERMIDTNIKGLLYVTRVVTPMMIENASGTIINVGSIAGREAYAKGNVYCATKFAVDALTQGMRIDLNGTGIRVGQIQPGMVDTEFSTVRFHGDKERANNVYQGLTPLSADDIADAIVYMAEVPPHVQIADLLILPTAQASATITHRK